MSQVVSFVDYVPAPRYDENPWTAVLIQEASTPGGPWVTLETLALDPVDADPRSPQSRSFTTDAADDAMGLWYRIVWRDAASAQSATLAVQNIAPEALSPVALCTDEDVRLYLGIKSGELSEDDRNTIIRLVNAASQTFTDESQRLWKLDPDLSTIRLYKLDSFDLQVGRIRIDDCTEITEVGYGTFNDVLGPDAIASDSWYPWQEEPGYPISAVIFADGLSMTAGNVISVDADWGWPSVPDKVRQAVIYTTAEWYARDVEKFSSTFSLDQGRILMPQVLPAQVQREAEGYRRWRVA